MIIFLINQQMKGSEQSEINQYYKLKNSCDLPLKLKIYFSLLENGMENHHHKSHQIFQSKNQFSKILLEAFNNLSLPEKGRYLLQSLNYVLQQIDRQQKDKTKSESEIQPDNIRNIQTTCQVMFSTLKIHRWPSFHFKLDKTRRMIFLNNKKKNFTINIHHYFVRRSKGYKNAVIMEAITDQITRQAKKYVINFSSSIIQRIYEEIFKCVLKCQNQRLLGLLADEEDDEKFEKQSPHNENSNKGLIILSSKNINQYLEYKQKIQKQCLTQKFQFEQIYKTHSIQIERSHKFDTIYKMEAQLSNYTKNFKEEFINALYYNNKYILSTQILENFSKKYKAVYERYLINNKIQEMISIREQVVTHDQQEILFLKTVENIMNTNYLDFMSVKLRNTSNLNKKIIVFLNINKTTKVPISQNIVIKFMVQLYEMIYRAESQKADEPIKKMKPTHDQEKKEKEMESDEQQDEDQFKTVKGDSEQFIEFMQGDYVESQFTSKVQHQITQTEIEGNQNKLVLLNSNRPFQKMQEMVEVQLISGPSNDYLKKVFELSPRQPLGNKIRMKEHYLFKQWVRSKTGGVICVDEAKISTQKNLFRLGLTRYGKNLIRGQILKISLPIQIFRKESHLETIARNLSYSPLFLERFSSPNYSSSQTQKEAKMMFDNHNIQRMKYCTLLAVSIGTVGILMDKPFNPILGETIQLWIDGCPMYVEQISHHPPIASYYFIGRGYTIHGMIEPKMNFGMNYIRGFSPQPNFINFRNSNQGEGEDQIEMNFGKMIIKGLLFGDRQFNFQGKIYIFDKNNLIFSDVIYGPNKKAKSKISVMTDYVHGKIYRVTKDFLQRFQTSNPRIHPRKDDIVQTLASFEGIWNDIFMFDGIQYVNFRTDLPCSIEYQKDPLPSNSSYRTDLHRLIEDNLLQAQKQKDRMQDLQRYDRKLREQMGHSHK